MKRRKNRNKYTQKPIEETAPICPICGKHPIVVRKDIEKYKLDGEDFEIEELSFQCFDDGEFYATPEMVQENTNRLRQYMLKKEAEKKSLKDSLLNKHRL